MISRIGHVGLRVSDLDRSVDFAQRVMGLRETEREGRISYLTCNSRHHELVLIEGPVSGCDHLALEVFDPDALTRLRDDLDARGIHVLADVALEPGINDAVHLVAPGGFVFEIFYGMATDQPAHYETVGVRPRKFEHITIKSSHKDEMENLLIEVLGLRLSDRAGEAISWMRASDEHHGVSVIGAEVDQLQHYAWQTDGWDSLRRTGDRLMQEGRTLLWGPGHHGIGNNYFCYFEDFDGAIVEYSSDIQRIENESTHMPRTWRDEPLSVNRWGNPPPPTEFAEGGAPLVNPAMAPRS